MKPQGHCIMVNGQCLGDTKVAPLPATLTPSTSTSGAKRSDLVLFISFGCRASPPSPGPLMSLRLFNIRRMTEGPDAILRNKLN